MRFDYLLKRASIATIILTFSLTAVGKIPITKFEIEYKEDNNSSLYLKN